MAKSVNITYYPDATAKCTNCGSVYTLGSTVEKLSVEICGNCHPFYTGKETLVDTAGRIEKFQARLSKVGDQNQGKKAKVKARKSRQSAIEMDGSEAETNEPQTETQEKVQPEEAPTPVQPEPVPAAAE